MTAPRRRPHPVCVSPPALASACTPTLHDGAAVVARRCRSTPRRRPRPPIAPRRTRTPVMRWSRSRPSRSSSSAVIDLVLGVDREDRLVPVIVVDRGARRRARRARRTRRPRRTPRCRGPRPGSRATTSGSMRARRGEPLPTVGDHPDPDRERLGRRERLDLTAVHPHRRRPAVADHHVDLLAAPVARPRDRASDLADRRSRGRSLIMRPTS